MVDKRSNWRDQVSLDVNLIEQESPRSIIKDIKNIKEELGDLLLQVVLFSQVSKDNNMFSYEEVCNEITKKISEAVQSRVEWGGDETIKEIRAIP